MGKQNPFGKKFERIRAQNLDKVIEGLEAERAKLVFLQTSPFPIEALRALLADSSLTRPQREEIRRCMAYLVPDE